MNLNGVNNESDVEQKLIYPLMASEAHLGYMQSEIWTKQYIRGFDIDKGKARSGYFPDYVVALEGVPVLVLEAKGPGADLSTALKEARLYATELNAKFPTGLNPVSKVVAANDVDIIVANWDSDTTSSYRWDNLGEHTKELQEIRQKIGRDSLYSFASDMRKKLWPPSKFKPLRFMSPAKQKDEIEPNQFAKSLIPLIKKFFDPDASRTKLEIVEKAYVPTEAVTRYNEILEALLADNLGNKKYKTFSEVETTKNDAQIFNKALKQALERGNKTDSLLLLIGSVGAGKSIFIDRFFYYLIDEKIRRSTLWAFVDFNNAPSDLADVSQWIAKQILADLPERNAVDDFESYENLLRYFNRDISRFKSGVGAKLPGPDYEIRLSSKLEEWTSDPEFFLERVLKFFEGDGQRRVVVVFDNSDKRDRDQQLKIFQEVQSFRARHKAFCVLALRDETYDRYRREPPLDTILTPFTFRILPPRFLDVVKRRLELVIEDISENADKRLEFQTGNGAVVRYPSSDLGRFLISFYQSLFHPSRELRLLLEALAGRSVRQALQMFSDILMSGHLSADAIFTARASNVTVFLAEKTILRVLMRTGFRYYSEGHGYIYNIFYQQDEYLSSPPFLRVLILTDLAERRKVRGELGIEGYHLARELVVRLGASGFGEKEVISTLSDLLVIGLVQADHQRFDVVEAQDHVKITASGWYHLRFVASRFEYACGVAADVWYATEAAAQVVNGLSLHDGFSMPRRASDRKRRVRLLIEELERQKQSLEAGSVVAELDAVQSVLDSLRAGLAHFESARPKQLGLGLKASKGRI